jgi:hypothetical protein
MNKSPEEKAEELVNKFISHTRVFHEVLGWEDYIDSAKQCALIAVDELIKSHYLLTTTHDIKPSIRCKSYWKEVKEEINNL